MLQGAGSFDISQLILPFQGVAGAAQLAEQAIQNGLLQVASHSFDAHTPAVDPKKKEKRPYKPRDPNAPKRPLTAYFRYLREVRPFIAQEVAKSPPSEGTKAGDISKIATERWKAMTDAQRQPYHLAYQGEMGAYAEATRAYKAVGGHIEDDAESPDIEAESPSALPVNGVTPVAEEEESDGSSTSDEDSSSEEDSDEEEAAPAKLPTPPPPPVKMEKKTPKPKKVKAAADAAPVVPFNNITANHNIDPQLTDPVPVATPGPRTAPAASQQPSTASKKRKAAAETPGTTDGGEKKKRGRPSKEDVAKQAAIAPAPQQHQPVPVSSQAETASGTEKKKKRKRKSEAAAAA